MSARRMLRALLLSLFDCEEARIFFEDHYPAIVNRVRWKQTPEAAMHHLVKTLDKQGLVDDDFFANLITAFPNRRADINRVRNRWKELVAPSKFAGKMLLGILGMLCGTGAALAAICFSVGGTPPTATISNGFISVTREQVTNACGLSICTSGSELRVTVDNDEVPEHRGVFSHSIEGDETTITVDCGTDIIYQAQIEDGHDATTSLALEIQPSGQHE